MNFSFYCDMYHCTIWVSMGKPDEAMQKFLKPLKKHGYNHKEYIEDESKFSGTVETFSRNVLIWLAKEPTDSFSYGVLSHEILHTTIAILRSTGMSLTVESEEAYTYLTQWLTQKIFDKLLKKEKSAA